MRAYLDVKARRAQAMTIAIGFKCDDGVILLSDRQISKEGGMKYYEKKLFEVSEECENGLFHLSFVYTGDPDGAKLFISELEERALDLQRNKRTLRTLKTCVQETLENDWKKHKSHMRAEFLCSISVTNEGFKLFRSRRNLLIPAEFECLGVGDSSLVRYLVESFATPRMGVRHYLPLLIYVMHQAKKYVEGCGGPTDVMYVRKLSPPVRGMHSLHGRLSGADKNIERETLSIESGMGNLFEHFYDPEASEDSFAKHLEWFSRRLTQFRKSLESRNVMEPINLRKLIENREAMRSTSEKLKREQ